MLDIGWQEIAIIFAIALVVVGPRDMPKIIRTAGEWMGKVRGYARDFQRTIEEAADYTEINAIKKEIEAANKELTAAKRDMTQEADDISRMMSEKVDGSEKKADTAKSNGDATDTGDAEPDADKKIAATKEVPAKPSSSPSTDMKPPTTNGAGDDPANPQTSS